MHNAFIVDQILSFFVLSLVLPGTVALWVVCQLRKQRYRDLPSRLEHSFMEKNFSSAD